MRLYPSFSLLLLLAVLAFLSSPSHSLTVHLVPHTHDDVGWLKTVDQYYVGLHNEIQHAMVQFIIDSVILELAKDPNRRFMYVEQAFFQRWWRQQNEATRALTQRLVKARQLEFVNGGWCMHDEASTYYVDMIDQTTLGHKFIALEFGEEALPTIGWQIDPFGHSSTQAALMVGEVGFDALFFARIDHQDYEARSLNRTLEMIWKGSPVSQPENGVFTDAFYRMDYGPPRGLCFDWFCGDDPVQDDPRLNDYNLPQRVADFKKFAYGQAAATAGQFDTQNILWPMGSDFNHENSAEWYINLDKLIKGVNADGNMTAMYSTPSIYLAAKNKEHLQLPIKTDDFFPYSDGWSGYWTGYFTSRTGLKRYVRFASNFLLIARQLEVFTGGNGSVTEPLWEAQSVAQHHDGVSGTSKQAVAFDYAQRIAAGYNIADQFVQSTLASLVTPSGSASAPPLFSSCPLSNVSICPVTQAGDNSVVLLYNPTAHTRREVVSVPVTDSNVGIADDSGRFIAYQLAPVMGNSALTADSAAWRLLFTATIPPLSLVTYFIVPSTQHRHSGSARADTLSSTHAARVTVPAAASSSAPPSGSSISSSLLTVSFDLSTNLISSITDRRTNASFPFTQDWGWYPAYTGDGQQDGAYVFRPNQQWAYPLSSAAPSLQLVHGHLVSEAWQVFSPWLSQIVRLKEGSGVVEFEWTVGPIPLADGIGKEIIARYNSSLQSAGVFYTDSNGREFQQRRRDYRATWAWQRDQNVSSNYYPINACAWLADNTSALVINNDRSQAGGSIEDGHLELLVHRRLTSDDSKGVSEPLSEPGLDGKGLVVTGIHTVAIVPLAEAAPLARRQQNLLYNYLHQSFAPLSSSVSDYAKSHKTSLSFSKGELPQEVELITLQSAPVPVNGTKVLVRVSHSFGAGEGSQAVSFDLQSLFLQPLDTVVELALTAATHKKGNSGYVWNTTTGATIGGRRAQSPRSPTDTTVTLQPLQIRTFGITVAQ